MAWVTPRDELPLGVNHASEAYRREPILRPIQAFALRAGCARQQAVDNSAWYRSSYYNENQRACGLDEFLDLDRRPPLGRVQNLVSVLRPQERGAFHGSERRLVRLFHAELARHFGASLITLDDPSPAGLAPRLAATLRCLLEGDSEKQVAARLGLSRATVHEYVKAVYRHFHVSSRPAPMAYFLRRTGFKLPDVRDDAGRGDLAVHDRSPLTLPLGRDATGRDPGGPEDAGLFDGGT